MLKKMRRRFVGAAMAAFTTVVLTLLCCVNVWNWQNIVTQLDGTLEILFRADGRALDFVFRQEAPPQEGGGPFSGEMPYMIRFFTVCYGADGELSKIDQDYIASVTEADAAAFAEHVLAGGRERGFCNGYRYCVSRENGGTTVVFLNAQRELRAIWELLANTLLIAGCCLAVLLVLVLLFSRRAVAPYMRNLEMQKQFITNAGHELKTPLTAISTSADVLASEYEDNEWVRNIQLQSGRLARLIASLVTLSRLDEEAPRLERCEFSLSDALWETADPFALLVRSQGKVYFQQIDDGLTVTGDRAAVQQMVSILLDNAVKYSPAGGEVGLRACRSGRRVAIEVWNTCGELDHAELRHLFERFYRSDRARSGAVSGSGIGLSIAKATAEALGGRIRVEQSGNQIRFQILL